MEKVKINDDFIKLDQFLKFAGAIPSGGVAKLVILNGDVKVNGIIAKERGKKLHKGDIIEVDGAGEFQID